MTVNDEIASEDLIRTMTPAQIEKLIPQRKFDQLLEEHSTIADDNCTICIDYLKNGQKLRCVPLCKHIFHSECLLNWLMVTEVCPNCKNEISIYTLKAYYDSIKQTRKDKDKKEAKREDPKLRPDARGRAAHSVAGSGTEIVFSRLTQTPNPNQSMQQGRSGADLSRNPKPRLQIADEANNREEDIEEFRLEDPAASSPRLAPAQSADQGSQ